MKTTLKKIIRDITARSSDDEDTEIALGQDGRRYLDYDLEAVHAFIKSSENRRVFVSFEDGEAFESSLLGDLIALFRYLVLLLSSSGG